MPFVFDDEIEESEPQFAPEKGNFQFEEEEPSTLEKGLSMGKEGLRHLTRVGSRAAETVAGFPGDLVNFSKFVSEKLPESPQFSKEKEPNFVKRAGRRALEWLPTSEELKGMTSYLTSGFTDPQGAMEEFGDDITSMATSLLVPAKDPTKFKSFLKAIGTATAAKGSSKGLELIGAGPTAQATAELGTLFLTGLMGKKTADAFVGDQFKKARSKIPQGTMINTQKLESELLKIEQQLAQGVSTNTKDEVKRVASELRAKASGGAMPAEELVESYHNINERINSKKLFDELKSSERKVLKHRYDKVKDVLNSEIESYGKKNPEFYNQWKEANQAFATIADSKKVSNFLQSKIGSLPKHLVGTVAIELFLGHPHAAAATIGAAGAVKTGELMYRIAKSPKLREHYLKVIKEASKENMPGVIKSLNALNKESKDMNQDTPS